MSRIKYRAKRKQKNFKIIQAKKLIKWSITFKKWAHIAWFALKSVNKDRFVLSYGPRDEILFVLDQNENENVVGPLQKLKVLFEKGFIRDANEVVYNHLPYFTDIYQCDGLIEANKDKKELENAGMARAEYSFVYVIDASKNSNLNCIPFSKYNTMNPKFFEESDFEFDNDEAIDIRGSFYIIPSSCQPKYIVGAFANQYLAHSLNISHDTLIVNPNYLGDLDTIKNKLNIRKLKELNDCRLESPDYYSAENAYELGPNSVEGRYQKIIKDLDDKIKNEGLEFICLDSKLLTEVNKVIERTPFTPEQLKKIEQKVNGSETSNQLIYEEKCRALHFEVGAQQSECLISRLPAEVREQIYKELFPLEENYKKESMPDCTIKKHQERFATEIIENSINLKKVGFFASEKIDRIKRTASLESEIEPERKKLKLASHYF